MARMTKKIGFSVKITPMAGGRVFDIQAPKDELGRPQRDTAASRKSNDFFRFFAMAFVLFLLLNLGSLYHNGWNFLTENAVTARAGYEDLQSGISLLKKQDFDKAGTAFGEAGAIFETLQEGTRPLTAQANQFIEKNLYLGTAQAMIDSGVLVSQIGQELSAAAEKARALPDAILAANRGGGAGADKAPTRRLRDVKNDVDAILAKTEVLRDNLAALNLDLLPTDLRPKILAGREQVTKGLTALNELDGALDAGLKLMGERVPHRVLVLLQNKNELRATGGFIGSYALVDVNDGVIGKVEVRDVYSTDGQLMANVPAPPGIDRVAEKLYMRDANYSPDFPTSARQITWLLEHSRGPSADSVVAIDQTVAEALLRLTGPIHIDSLGADVTADNFSRIFSFLIETKQSGEREPKKLLAGFVPLMKKRLFEGNTIAAFLPTVQSLIAERHIQAYSADPDIESLFTALRVDGRMPQAPLQTDFLALATTSIGGNKSDAFLHSDVALNTAVEQNGALTDTLTLTKKQTWSDADTAAVDRLITRFGPGALHADTIRFIMGQGDNNDFLRVYVPRGSRLLATNGVSMKEIQTSEDLGYSVFTFDFGPVAAGTAKTVTLQYALPFSLSLAPSDNYKLLVQKQAGAENMTFLHSLATADGLKVAKTYPDVSVAPKPLTENQVYVAAIQR